MLQNRTGHPTTEGDAVEHADAAGRVATWRSAGVSDNASTGVILGHAWGEVLLQALLHHSLLLLGKFADQPTLLQLETPPREAVAFLLTSSACQARYAILSFCT